MSESNYANTSQTTLLQSIKICIWKTLQNSKAPVNIYWLEVTMCKTVTVLILCFTAFFVVFFDTKSGYHLLQLDRGTEKSDSTSKISQQALILIHCYANKSIHSKTFVFSKPHWVVLRPAIEPMKISDFY